MMTSWWKSWTDTYYDIMDNQSDQRLKDWPLMSGPMVPAMISIFYVYIVKVLGPKLMENRKPFELRRVMIYYNLLQVIFSIWMLVRALKYGWWNDYSFICEPIDFSNNPRAIAMAEVSWWYFMAKYTEFIDTFLFVLRKKNDHVSALHVIHHGLMPFSTWFGVKFSAGGHLTFFGLINTFVHVVMYTYYFLAALGPQLQPYLWWKKYLTTMQMIQFVIILIHTSQLFFFDCLHSGFFKWLVILHSVLFLYLFRNFYVNTYIKSSKKKSAVE